MAYNYGGASPLQQPTQIYPGGQQQYTQQYGPPRSASPHPPAAPQQPIQPGTITYTTTTGADGQVTYHPFRAVPASYQTPNGPVSGIQWVPAEATSVLPQGGTLAGAEFAAAFNRPTSGQGDRSRREKEDRRYEKEHRSSYREEKEYRRERDYDDRGYRRDRDYDRDRHDDRHRGERRRTGDQYGSYDRDRRDRESESEDELERRFHNLDLDRRGYPKDKPRDREREERDYRDREREREYERERAKGRKGSSGYPTAPGVVPGAAPYATAPYPPGTYPAAAPGGAGIGRPVSPYQAGVAPRPASPYRPAAQVAPVAPRPMSPYQAGGPIAPRPVSPYQVGGVLPPQQARPASPYHQPGVIPRSASPYHTGAPIAPRPASPYGPPAVLPRSASPHPPGVYPPGHVMEGQPIGGMVPGVDPRSMSPSMPGPTHYASIPSGPTSPGTYPVAMPRSGYPGSPQIPTDQSLAEPEGFSRAVSLSQTFTPFDVMKIQDMDDFFENIPRMPMVLVTHDIYHEDWIRFMTDMSLAWSGKLPVPEYAREAGPPRRNLVTADLVDVWNVSFFHKRGVEAVLYKGRERRSGREVGRVDVHLPGFDEYGDEDSEELSEDSEFYDSEKDDRYAHGGTYASPYGRQVENQMHDLYEARIREKRLREKRRTDKKKRRQEKKHKRRLRESERKYALYLTYIDAM